MNESAPCSVLNSPEQKKGLYLARAYYEQCGKPRLHARFSADEARMATGLVGEGSECFGYDDALSMDHDFGPAFCIWLTDSDFARIGKEVELFYASLPQSFMGFPARREGAHGGKRVGVFAISDFYRKYTGFPDARLSAMQWLRIPESGLATVTNGEVFVDPPGAFTAVRQAFLDYYPEDVRLKKIAARLASMAQSGQYNFSRCLRRAEVVAARLALGEFMSSTMSVLFLLHKRYMPFYKWAHRGLRDLALPSDITGSLSFLASGAVGQGPWHTPCHNSDTELHNGTRTTVSIIEQLCAYVATLLKQQGLSKGEEDFLVLHAEKVMSKIQDKSLRSLHLLDG